MDKLSPGGTRELESLVMEARQYLTMRGKMPGPEMEMVARHEAFIGDFERRQMTEETGESCLSQTPVTEELRSLANIFFQVYFT